jgi:hypothetical protein
MRRRRLAPSYIQSSAGSSRRAPHNGGNQAVSIESFGTTWEREDGIMRIGLTCIFADHTDHAERCHADGLGFETRVNAPYDSERWLVVISPDHPNCVELMLRAADQVERGVPGAWPRNLPDDALPSRRLVPARSPAAQGQGRWSWSNDAGPRNADDLLIRQSAVVLHGLLTHHQPSDGAHGTRQHASIAVIRLHARPRRFGAGGTRQTGPTTLLLSQGPTPAGGRCRFPSKLAAPASTINTRIQGLRAALR